MSPATKVDFYLLEGSNLSPQQLTCVLAGKAWENTQAVNILVSSEQAAQELDTLLWNYPPQRFIPHAVGGDQKAAIVQIYQTENLLNGEVLINLSSDPVKQPERFTRVLEIVPAADDQRSVSRTKFRAYRQLGIQPQTHNIKR